MVPLKRETLILYVPDIKTKFPDFVEEKWTLSDIEAFCDKYGLNLEKEEVEVATTAGYKDGEVINTNRAKGSDIVKGTTLRVKIAKVVKPVASQAPNSSPSTKPNENSGTDSNNGSDTE